MIGCVRKPKIGVYNFPNSANFAHLESCKTEFQKIFSLLFQASSNGSLTDDFTAVKYFGVLSQRMKIVANDLRNVLPSGVIQELYDATNHLIGKQL